MAEKRSGKKKAASQKRGGIRKANKPAVIISAAILLLLAAAALVPFVGGVLLGTAAMAVFYAVALAVFFYPGNREQAKSCFTGGGAAFAIAAAAVVMMAIAAYLITQERFIYYWDYSGYWMRVLDVAGSILEKPAESLFAVCRSINEQQYNYIIPLLMALPVKAFGGSYVSFVLTAMAMFVIPSVLVTAAAADKFCRLCGREPAPFWLTAALAASAACITAPCLQGYYDAAGLLYAAALLYLAIDWDWKRFDLIKSVHVMALLLSIMLLRRYFAFFVVGFVLGWAAQAAICLLAAGRRAKPMLGPVVLTFGLIGGLSLTLLLTVFSGFFRMSALVDYSEIYSAYASGGSLQNIISALRYFGWLAVAAAAAAAAYAAAASLRSKNPAGGAAAAMLAVAAAAAMLSFLSVQSMGVQHRYIITAQVVILTAAGVLLPCSHIAQKRLRAAACSACAAVFCAGMLMSLSVIPVDEAPAAFPRKSYAPRVRDDIPQLRQLDARLKELTGENDSAVYILASSGTLNNDILNKLYFPERNTLKMPGHAHVDLRDGINPQMFLAEYVVVCDPVQTHLASGAQTVITIPAQNILDGVGIGENYAFVEQHQLGGGVSARIYRRVGRFSREMLDSFAAQYDALYPGREDLFRNRIMSYL